MKIIALFLALAASAHEPTDWQTFNGYHAARLRSGDNGAFQTDMRRAYALPDGSIVGWTDTGTHVVFQVLRPDGTFEDVARAPWSTPSCTLRSADGGPEFDVDATQGRLLVECHGAVGQLWRIDGFIACPCGILRGAAIDPAGKPYVGIAPANPLEIFLTPGVYLNPTSVDDPEAIDWRRTAEPDDGTVRMFGASPWRVAEREERKATWAAGHHAVPGMVVDDEDDEDDEPRERVTSGWIVNGTMDGHSTGCDPLLCDDDSRDVQCLEQRDGREDVAFICDGGRWVTAPAAGDTFGGGDLAFDDEEIVNAAITGPDLVSSATVSVMDVWRCFEWNESGDGMHEVPCDSPAPSAPRPRGSR